jgi:TPR repeat protein
VRHVDEIDPAMPRSIFPEEAMAKGKLLFVAALAVSVISWSGPATADLGTAISSYRSGDDTTALKERKPLVDAGDLGATDTLGVMYDSGPGVPKDRAIAAQWLRKAADGGDVSAQRRLGQMHAYGLGVQKPEGHQVRPIRRAVRH